MSNSVDQRIVEMHFDNAQFEKGVAQTMKSLMGLDKQLELKNGVKGLQEVDKAAARVDLSGMEKGVSRVESLFSALKDTAGMALDSIAGRLANLGSEVVQGLTIQPLTDGLGEYTTKLGSIQTIQANTLGKPNSSMRDITDTLDDLNAYADKTIYNFAEMTRNIGTFTAAGVGLKESQVAIKGIANMAAASGASSYDASRAMYQLSQALASGSLKLQDWNSVVNANMGGQLFQEALLRTSDALQTGGRAAVETAGSFRESLKAGWVTQEVLTNALRNMTLATDDMTKAQEDETRAMLEKEGYTKDQIETIFQEANVAQEAATKVKTFEQLVDTTREALGSGWATTWEYIIGDLDQAKALWTPIADRLGNIINAFSDARNDLLRVWNRGSEELGLESGRDAVLQGLGELVKIADALVKPIGDAWNSVFKAMDPRDLYNLSVGFRDFATGLRESFEHSSAVKAALGALQTVFAGLFGAAKLVATLFGGALLVAFKAVGTVATVVFTGIETVATVISKVFAIAQGAASKLGKGGFDFFGGIADFLRKNTGIDKNLANIVESIDRVVDGLGKLFSGKVEEGMATLEKAFSAISKNAGSFFKNMEKFTGGKVKGFLDFLNNVRSNAPAVALKIYTFLTEQFAKLQPLLQPIADGMESVGKSFVLALDAFKGLSSGAIFDQFGSSIANAFASITDFTDLSQLQRLGGQIKSAFKSLFGSIGSEISDFFKKFTSGLNLGDSPIGLALDIFGAALEKLGSIGEQIKAFGSGLIGDDPLGGFTSFIENLKNSIVGVKPSEMKEGMDGIAGIVDAVAETADKVKGVVEIKSMMGNPFEALGALLANLANGLGSGIDMFLSKLDAGKIKDFLGTLAAFGISAGTVVGLYNMSKALGGIAEILESLGNFSEVIEKVGKSFSKLLKAKAMQAYAEAFKSFAIAIGIMAAAAIVIALVGPDKVMSAIPVVLALVGLMTAITVLFGFLSKLDKFDFGGIVKVAAAMLELSLAVGILAIAVAAFSAITGGSWTGILQIAAIMGIIVVVSAIVSKIDTSGIEKMGSSMAKIAVSLLLMYAAIQLFAGMDTATLAKGAAAVTGLMLVVALISRVMGTGSKTISINRSGSSSMAKNLLAIAATIFIMYEVVKGLSAIDEGSLGRAVEALAFIVLIMAALNYAMTEMGKTSKGGGAGSAATLLAMSVAIGVFAIAVGALSFALSSGANVWGALAIIALGIGVMAGALALMGKFAPQLDGAAAALLGMVVAIAAFTAVVLVLSSVPWETILAGIVNVSMILGVFLLALLGIGAIGELVGVGLLAVGGAFVLFGVALIGIAAALLIGVAALAAFTAISGAFVPAFEQFTAALIACFQTEDFVGSMIGMSVAMALLGAACLILGVGLGVLSLAVWAFGEVFPRAVMTVTAAIMQLTTFFSANRDAIASGITNMLDAGVQGIMGFFGKFLEAGGNLVKNISSGLSSHTGDIRNGVADVISTLGNLLWEGITTLGPVLLELLGGLASGILEGIANLVTGPIEWLNDKVYEFTGGLMGVAPQAKEGAEELATQTAEGIASKDAELGESTKAKIDEIDAHIREKTPEAGAASQEMATAVTNPFEQKGASFDFFKAIGLDETTLSGGFDSVKSFLGEKGIELPDEVITQFTSGASGFDAWNIMETNGNVDMSQFTTLMGDAGGEGATALTNTFSEQMTLADVSNLVANAAEIDTAALNEKFSSAAGEAAQAFTQGFTDNMEIDGSGPMEKAAAALKASSSSMESTGSTLGKSVSKGFSSGAKDMKAKGKTAASEGISGVSNQASSAYSAGSRVGARLSEGLANGIRSVIPAIRAAADEAVSQANRVVEAKAKISSPSRVWMQYGHYMGEGLVIGLRSMKNAIGQASEDSIDAAATGALALQKASYLSGLLDDIDDQPTIRPVLDLTDYEAGINRMKGLNASAPMNSAQWANRLTGTLADGSYYNNNRSMVINLNYGAGTSAADMVNEMAMILQTKNLMEA